MEYCKWNIKRIQRLIPGQRTLQEHPLKHWKQLRGTTWNNWTDGESISMSCFGTQVNVSLFIKERGYLEVNLEAISSKKRSSTQSRRQRAGSQEYRALSYQKRTRRKLRSRQSSSWASFKRRGKERSSGRRHQTIKEGWSWAMEDLETLLLPSQVFAWFIL